MTAAECTCETSPPCASDKHFPWLWEYLHDHSRKVAGCWLCDEDRWAMTQACRDNLCRHCKRDDGACTCGCHKIRQRQVTPA